MTQAVALVFVFGLITALATGLGAIPFLFLREISPRSLAVANAIAAGLMLGASFGLLLEGRTYGILETVIGGVAGAVFIFLGERFLEGRDVQIGALTGASARRILLLVAVMTMHSFSEGVAVGVSFGGGEALASLITLAIAVHNVPEGLAISLPLAAEGVGFQRCFWWSVLSSLPQPLAAVPAVLLIVVSRELLPSGLGFAAGAMSYLVLAELIPESLEKAGKNATAWGFVFGFVAMMLAQYAL